MSIAYTEELPLVTEAIDIFNLIIIIHPECWWGVMSIGYVTEAIDTLDLNSSRHSLPGFVQF